MSVGSLRIRLPVFSTLAVGKCKYEAVPGRENDLTAPLLRTAALLGRPEFRAEMQGMAVKKKAEKADKARKRAA